MIRDIVLRAYSEALESGENGDVLVVTIITLKEYEYRFRAYEEEDIPFETTKMTGNNNGCDADDKIPVQNMSFEERMEALKNKALFAAVKAILRQIIERLQNCKP